MQIQISWLLQKPTDLDLVCKDRVYPGSGGQGLKSFFLDTYNDVNIINISVVNFTDERKYYLSEIE